MKIEIDISQAVKGLNIIQSRINDLTPVMRPIAGLLADITEDAFDGQYDPSTGAGWVGLLPATIKARKRKGQVPIKILQARGELAVSVVTEYGKDFAQIGTNKEYAAAHQFGVESFSDRSGELEPRPFIGYSEQDAEDIESMVADFLRA